MQRVNLITVGKLKEPFYLAAVQEYSKRLSRYCKLSCIELAEQRLGEEPSPAEIRRALATEAVEIRGKLPKDGIVVALCIEGKEISSENFSQTLANYAIEGYSQISFIIGSSFGMDETLKKEADVRLSLSPMTFPHHLARVMLLEQIYRAYQIMEGSKYHK